MNLFESQSNEFTHRHIGPDERETQEMLQVIGVNNIDELINKTVPSSIRMKEELNLPEAMSEHEYLQHIKNISLKNKLFKNYIGQGYYDTITPSVILRNVFENPGLVHTIHALPGRNFAGALRKFTKLSNYGK